MNRSKLRSPYEIPLYVLSVLVNLLIIALILVGALFLGFLNALAGEPLSGPAVDAIRAAFVALLLIWSGHRAPPPATYGTVGPMNPG